MDALRARTSNLEALHGTVEIRRILQLPPVAFEEVSCTTTSLGEQVCVTLPPVDFDAFLVSGSDLSVDGTTPPTIYHFDTLLNTHASQNSGGNVQIVNQNILNVFVPKSIIASGQGAHRFRLDNSNGSDVFDFTAVSLGHEIVSETFTNSSGDFDRTLFCPNGKVVTGGGVIETPIGGILRFSGPVGINGWRVVGSFSGTSYTVHAICVNNF